jgi:hypothetical protein
MHDHLSDMGVAVFWEQAHWRVKYQDQSVRFTQIEREELVQVLNTNMAVALSHLTGNVDRSGYPLDSQVVKEAGLAVVLQFVHLYNSWRNTYDQYRDHTLAVSAADLTSVSARGEIIHFCRLRFGPQYADNATALTGMSRGELADFEASQAAYANAK